MEKNEFIDRLLGGKMSRRELNRALGAAGLGLAAMPLLSTASRAAGELTVFTWSEYDDPGFHPAYIEKHGQSPSFSFFATEEEALQKLRAGFESDVLHPCSYNIRRWKDAGILQPIDTSRIPNYSDIWEKFKTIPSTSFDGQSYFVPWDSGIASIIYRTDLIDPADVEPPSWNLLFNEKYKGRLSMYDTDTTLIEIAARILGYDNYTTLSDEQLETIRPMLVKQRDLMPFYWSDATQIEQALASGEIVAAYAWNDAVGALKEQGVPIAFMAPEEGSLPWVCGLVLHKDAQAVDLAYDFMDAMLAPEVGAYLITDTGYAHSNRKAYDLVDQAVLDGLGLTDPEKIFATANISDEADEPYRTKYINLVTEVKAGIN